MNSLTFLALLIIVLAQLMITISANDPLLAEAHGLDLDLREHVASLAKEEKLLESMDILTTTFAPTLEPTFAPSAEPTAIPTAVPTATPTATPTTAGETPIPSAAPTYAPSAVPTVSAIPTAVPTAIPTAIPTAVPTATPTRAPSAVPTRSPTNLTPTPTASPTQASTPVISFSSSLALGGLSSPDLSDTSKLSISQATCLTMQIPESQCQFWGSVAVLSSRRALRAVATNSAASRVHMAATYTVTAYVNTTIAVPSNFTGSADSYYTSLTDKLTPAALTSNLEATAASNGDTSTFSGVTVTGVTSTPPVIVAPAANNDDNDKKKLSGGAIAGIVIAVIVVFALICVAIYFFFFRESAGYQSTGDSNFNARHHRNSKELPITL